MSCSASVVVVGGVRPDRAAVRGIARLVELEHRWSRFLPHSDVTRLNGSPGRAIAVDHSTVRLVTALVEGWHVTGGLFDPTLLEPLVRAGYAASRVDSTDVTVVPADVGRSGRPDEILVDVAASTVELPPGTVLDPGGLGKGLAADMVVEELLANGAAGALVEVGGDVRVSGEPPTGDAWTIAVEHAVGQPLAQVRLRDGGVATSTTTKRTWTHGGSRCHHLIDPATGHPANSTVASATVVAGSARSAEVLTKPAFVGGVDVAFELIDRHEAAAIVSTGLGRCQASRGWPRYSAPCVDGRVR